MVLEDPAMPADTGFSSGLLVRDTDTERAMPTVAVAIFADVGADVVALRATDGEETTCCDTRALLLGLLIKVTGDAVAMTSSGAEDGDCSRRVEG